MKYQILFTRKNKKNNNISLSSAEYAHTKIVADNTVIILLFLEKIRLHMSCELSARQTIHTKCQFLFSLKNNKVSSAIVVIGALRVNI